MGFLRTDYSDVGGFGVLPVGEYEVIVSEVKMKDTSTGKKMISATLTIRDDVEQEGRKRKLFDNMVIQDNMMWKFQQVGKAVQIPEGEDIASPEDFMEAILYKPARIKVGIRKYNGDDQNEVKAWMESQVDGDGGFSGGNDGGSIDISDDDLPF